MSTIIFLPGIMGSELYLRGNRVWPPSALEVRLGYHRVEQLLDGACEPGGPIEAVACLEVYRPLLDDLREIAAGRAGAPPGRLFAWGYDWRIDVRTAARTIAEKLDRLAAADRREIRIVAHSMGCVVARVLLESGSYDHEPWFGAVRSFTALAGPNSGSPDALVKALGLEGSSGLSAQALARMAKDSRYPALYQMFPSPEATSLVEVRGNELTPLDLYAKGVAARLDLDPGNVEMAFELYDLLKLGVRPPAVRYTSLAGSGVDTWGRIDFIGRHAVPRKAKEAGDGTVPLWSALDHRAMHHVAPAPHDSLFRHAQIRTLLYSSLGARFSAVAVVDSEAESRSAKLLPARRVYAPGTALDVHVIFDVPTPLVEGDLIIRSADDTAALDSAPIVRKRVVYSGPPIQSIRVRLDSPDTSGLFLATLEGTHAAQGSDGAAFAISADGGAAQEE